MKKTILFLLLLLPLAMRADNGISFEHGKSWSELRDKARAAGKRIYDTSPDDLKQKPRNKKQ